MVNIPENIGPQSVNKPDDSVDSSRKMHETQAELLKILAPFTPIEAQIQRYPASDPLDEEGNISARSILKEQNRPLLTKIWGNEKEHAVLAANVMQHVALFCIPQIAASAHLMQRNRYRNEETFERESSKTAEFLANAALGNDERDYSTFAIAYHHLPPEERNSWHIPTKTVHQIPVHHKHGIPHAAMAYSIYESLRAAEYIAIQKGVNLSPEELQNHFAYFAEILRRSGYRCPSDRQEMELLALQIDALAQKTETGAELVERALKHLNASQTLIRHRNSVKPSSLVVPQEWVRGFLRPHSQKVFDAILKKRGINS